MTSLLALHFDEPVQFIKIVGRRCERHHPHENAQCFSRASVVGNETDALRDAQDVPVYHKDALSEIAEVQCRGGDFRSDAWQLLQPSHPHIDRPIGQKRELETASQLLDRTSGFNDLSRLHICISHIPDDPRKIAGTAIG